MKGSPYFLKPMNRDSSISKDIPSVFARYRKPFKKPGMTKDKIIKLVDTGTDMMLADSLSDTPYNDKMMDKVNEVRNSSI